MSYQQQEALIMTGLILMSFAIAIPSWNWALAVFAIGLILLFVGILAPVAA